MTEWTSILERDPLPLVLAGPVVRRVEPTAVNVWIALSAEDWVTLTVFHGGAEVASTVGPAAKTTALGRHLHVALVTAVPDVALEPGLLYCYQLEFSSLGPATGAANFAAALGVGVLPAIVYDAGSPGSEAVLPSFTLPPKVLSDVRIGHSSCRKAHGEKADALPVFDSLLSSARASKDDTQFCAERVHQLFLTGDQVYCDDVNNSFLAMCIDAAGHLMGTRTEPPPASVGHLAPGLWKNNAWPHVKALALRVKKPPEQGHSWEKPWVGDTWPGVGERGLHAFAAGLTVDPPEVLLAQEHVPQPLELKLKADGNEDWSPTQSRSAASNHLMLLGEFYACMLLSWSPVLWQAAVGPSAALPLPYVGDATGTDLEKALPLHSSLRPAERIAAAAQVTRVRAFGAGLAAVRRVLANTPTYMVCDDHDVTDDWYINRNWCDRVLTMPGDTLGRRIVRNALVCYAVFQAWGNSPDQFATSPVPVLPTAGQQLLAELAAGREMTFPPPGPGPSVADLVGVPAGSLPARVGRGTTALLHPPGALHWHFRWGPPDWPYEVLVLDCRTMRAYGGPIEPAVLIDTGGAGRADQVAVQLPPTDAPRSRAQVTLVVVQTPVFGFERVEALQSLTAFGVKGAYANDLESWSANRVAQESVLAAMAARNVATVVLSGDVHYAFARVVDYWATSPWGRPGILSPPRTARVVQLVSSAAHNEAGTTRVAPFAGFAAGPRTVYATASATAPSVDAGTALSVATGVAGRGLQRSAPRTYSEDEFHEWFVKGAEPDWKYRVSPVPGTRPDGPSVSSAEPLATLPALARDILGAVGKLQVRTGQVLAGGGVDVVGANNVAVVSFLGAGPADWQVRQTTYLRPADDTGASTSPLSTSVFTVPLQYQTVG